MHPDSTAHVKLRTRRLRTPSVPSVEADSPAHRCLAPAAVRYASVGTRFRCGG
jgi:hypothetical protein